MPLQNAGESSAVVHRLRRVLSSVHLDCECRTTLDGALERFSDLEFRRRFRSVLRQARRQRDWIAAQLYFLAELDEINGREDDPSVFEEMATLFDEIRMSAANAAQAMREAQALMVAGEDLRIAHQETQPR